MNISIQFAENQEEDSALIYLISDTSQIDLLKLDKAQKEYLKNSLEEERAIIFPVFPGYSGAVYAKDEDSEGKTLEKVRTYGHKIKGLIKGKAIKELQVEDLSKNGELLLAFVEGLALSLYDFDKYKKEKKTSSLKAINVQSKKVRQSDLDELEAVVYATCKARDLVNEPQSFLDASQLAIEAEILAKENGFGIDIFNQAKIESLKMGGLLAVNQGSLSPATFSILEYKPAKPANKKPIIFVGKGVVYDTGGLSLKPTPNSMDLMKSDMGGAAAVIGAITAISRAKLNVHVIGLIPATDNRPSQNAYAPGDVITMFDGTTVEVMNTDAEGRLILADALEYAKKYKPELVIDLATLTGAAVRAIGQHGIVGMGNVDQKTFSNLQESGEKVYERVVRFPLWDEYHDELKSDIADLKNLGGSTGGASSAGKFLEHFTDYPWIHLDIAGPAFIQGENKYRGKNGTGSGVRLLFDYLKQMVK